MIGHFRIAVSKQNERQCKLAFNKIGSGSFTQYLFIRSEIEQVIGQLKCNSEIKSVFGESRNLLIGCSSKNCSDFAARRKQICSFTPQNIKILILGNIDLADGGELDQLA